MSQLNRRGLLLGSAGLAGVSLLQASCRAIGGDADQQGERLYTRLVVSEVVSLNGADFRTETEDRWDGMGLSVYPVSLRLRIANRSEQALLFPFADTFVMTLSNPDGTEHQLGGGRDGTRPLMRPLLLEPGQDFSIVPSVQMRWSRDQRELELVYEDGTGTILRSGLLPAGEYGVGFTYSVGKRWKDAFAKHVPEAAVWQGEVRTKPVAFQIVHT